MSQLARLALVIDGKVKNQAIDLNELAVGSITVGGTSGTNLTKTELDLIISTQHAPMSDNQNVVAGAGMTGGGSGATTTLDVVATDLSLNVAADSVAVRRDPAGAVQLGASGVFVGVDGSTLEINTNALRIKDLGVSTAKLADNAVTSLKLSSDASIDANRAVGTDHIKNTAVTSAKLDTSVAGAGLTGGAGTPLAVNVDNSTLEITVDTLNVKAGGITGTQLATSVAGAGLVGGGGSALAIGQGNGIQVDADSIQVLFAPSSKIAVTAGETFLANTTYLVRWAVDPETAGRVYKATASTATNKKYLVVGLLLSTLGLVAGNATTLLLNGLHTLGSSDTPFASSDIGKEVYLKNDGSGGFTVTPPTAVGNAQFRVGIVQSTTVILVDLKQLNTVIPEPQYDERTQFPSGLTSGTDITLPVNSRNGGAAQTYIASEGRLQIYLNQQLKFQGIDWTTGTSPTNQIKFNYALPLDAEVHFRLDPLSSGVISGGGGGGSGTLQDAYGNGSVINVTSGVPFTINGPVSEKILVINGDITVTGVIDPSAIQLSGQSSNPLDPGQAGIWVDMSGALMHEDGVSSATNISDVIAGVQDGTAVAYISKMYTNSTGSTITPFTPVYSPTAGHIAPADCNDLNKFRVIGITIDNIPNGSSGLVGLHGVIPGISATHNRYLYVGLTPGSLVDVGPTLGGYSSGFNVVRLGTVEGSNLILQIQHMGAL